MRLVATADLHGALPEIPECDVLVIAGDVCPVHNHSVPFQRSWLDTEFKPWLARVPAEHIIGIGGNHDFIFEYPYIGEFMPWHWLHDSAITIGGLRFYGMPWVPNLSRWAFHLDDHRLDDKMNAVPQDTDVLIVHGPPYGLLDMTVPKFGSVHAGFPGAVDTIDRVRPKLYLCGHIHEGYGVCRHGDTLVCNVSHMTENYEPINAPLKIQILDNGSVAYHGRQACGAPSAS